MVTRRVLVVVVCLVATAVTSAAALPRGSVVARGGGYTLRADETHRRICLTLKGNGEHQGNCGVPGIPTDFVNANGTSLAFGFGLGFGSQPAPPVPPVFAAAVPSDISEVGLETAGGSERHPTVAADGLKARFVLAPDVPGRVEFVRLYDDQGTLVSAGFPGFIGEVTDRHRAFARHGTRIVLGRTHELRGDLLRPDRQIESTCVSVLTGHGGGSSCSGDDVLGSRPLTVEETCAPLRPVLHGVLAPDVRRVAVVLGDGRHLRGQTEALPAAYGGLRFVALEIPPGAAVRSARLIDAGGHAAPRQLLGVPPSGLPCDDVHGGALESFAIGGTGRADTIGDTPPVGVADAGDHELLAADGSGRSLCVGLDRLRTRDCAVPPAGPVFGAFDRDGRLVYGVLPGRVKRVDIRLDDGSHQSATPTAGPAYGGRYAGRAGFVLARIPPGRRVKGARLYVAGGSEIGRGYISHYSPLRPTGRIPGSLVRTDAQRSGSDVHQLTVHCAFLPGTRRLGYPSCIYRRPTYSRSLTVTCRPHQIAATGYLAPGMTAVLGELSDGRTIAARILRPTRRQGGGRVFVLTVPRSAGLVALRPVGGKLRRHVQRREVVKLPPATEQCGYSVSSF